MRTQLALKTKERVCDCSDGGRYRIDRSLGHPSQRNVQQKILRLLSATPHYLVLSMLHLLRYHDPATNHSRTSILEVAYRPKLQIRVSGRHLDDRSCWFFSVIENRRPS